MQPEGENYGHKKPVPIQTECIQLLCSSAHMVLLNNESYSICTMSPLQTSGRQNKGNPLITIGDSEYRVHKMKKELKKDNNCLGPLKTLSSPHILFFFFSETTQLLGIVLGLKFIFKHQLIYFATSLSLRGLAISGDELYLKA